MATWKKAIGPVTLFLLVWVGLLLVPQPGGAIPSYAETNTPTAEPTDTPDTPPTATATQPADATATQPATATNTPPADATVTPTGVIGTPETPQPGDTPAPGTGTPIPTPGEIPGLGAGPDRSSLLFGGAFLLGALLLLLWGWFKIWQAARRDVKS